ncbi:MAG: methyltransferase [Myxococcales bacterium]
MDAGNRALFELGRELSRLGYRFTTPTPETHRRVVSRKKELSRDLRDVFGWSLPFEESLLPRRIAALLAESGALLREGRWLRSAVRFSSLGEHLFVHSAYPTRDADAVFFGPDTYRYCALLEARVQGARRCVDVGAGCGAGGIMLAPRCESVVLCDVNPRALRFAQVNAALAGVERTTAIVRSDVLAGVSGDFDLVVANPPYLADELHRTYRDGGGALGAELSVRIATEALERLPRGGGLVLYTATAIVDGEDLLLHAMLPRLRGTRFDYRELDPDVFGEELDRVAYRNVERIAVVALDAVKE